MLLMLLMLRVYIYVNEPKKFNVQEKDETNDNDWGQKKQQQHKQQT